MHLFNIHRCTSEEWLTQNRLQTLEKAVSWSLQQGINLYQMSSLDVDSPTKLKVTYADHTVEQLTNDGKWADHWDLLSWQLAGIMKIP